MSTLELRKLLIDKIEKIDNKDILEEVYRLLQHPSDDLEIYKLSDDQINIVSEAKEEIKRGKFLSDHEADNEIDEWLNK